MKLHRSTLWLLACSVAACTGVANAGPEDCLTLRDNASVAGCANRYAQAASPATANPLRQPARIQHRPIQVSEQWMQFPIPSARARAIAQLSEAPKVVVAPDRSELIGRIEIGAAGLVVMGLVFGMWRWRASPTRQCSFCGTRAVAGSTMCKHCFRAV
ncbi:MAG: hypothetical protein ABI607_00590 [Betaproteobacteria bacterium]